MKKYKLKTSFNGASYLGWQSQKDFSPTVQDELEKALSIVFKEKTKTLGSGRTDTGVHSLEHLVLFEAELDIPLTGLVKALNSHLPDSIRVLEAFDGEGFHPLADVKWREYRYLFTNNDLVLPHQAEIITNHRMPLDIEVMQRACQLFVGEHDFTDFHCKGSDTTSNIRIIKECEILSQEMDFHGILPSHYYLRIVGNGFLKQMVRSIMGVLFKAGEGKITEDEIIESLKSPTGNTIAPIAPPNGLFKYKLTL